MAESRLANVSHGTVTLERRSGCIRDAIAVGIAADSVCVGNRRSESFLRFLHAFMENDDLSLVHDAVRHLTILGLDVERHGIDDRRSGWLHDTTGIEFRVLGNHRLEFGAGDCLFSRGY